MTARETLSGVGLIACPRMVGAKVAVRYGSGPVYVSPAMFELIANSSIAELPALLESIHVVQLPTLAEALGIRLTTEKPRRW